MKKESLQVTTVRTLLAVLLFAGMGIIIFGGGCIIWEYSKNKVENEITRPVEQNVKSNDFYLKCDLDDDCVTTHYHINDCCLGCSIFSINKQGLELQKKWREKKCPSDDPCRTYKCLRIEKNVKCIQKKCEIINEAIDNTSDWQTYRNEEFGFEVKYPEKWDLADVKSDKEGIILIKGNTSEGDCWLGINLQRNLTSKNSKTFLSLRGLAETTMIAGQETFGVTVLPRVQSPGMNVYYFIKDEVLYTFQAVYYEKSDGEVEKILSTFKFIEN